jgi:hypothetical protein
MLFPPSRLENMLAKTTPHPRRCGAAPRFRLRFERRTQQAFEEDGETVFREACRLGCEVLSPKSSALSIAGTARLFG